MNLSLDLLPVTALLVEEPENKYVQILTPRNTLCFEFSAVMNPKSIQLVQSIGFQA